MRQDPKELLHQGNWKGAILSAAKCRNLGSFRNDILSAREALHRPDFQRQMKRNPAVLIAAGKCAVEKLYG